MQTPAANLSHAIQWLNVSYSIWFNRRHARIGPLFQGRFKSVLIENSVWAYELSVYVHLNPVRTKRLGQDKRRRAAESQGMGPPPSAEEVTRRLRELRQFKWSSYPCYAGYRASPAWLTTMAILRRAQRQKDGRVAAYRKAVRERISQGVDELKREQLCDGVVVGNEAFKARVRRLVKECGRENVGKEFVRSQCSFEDVIKAVERMKGGPRETFWHQRGDWGKGLVLWGSRQYCGMRLREIGAAANGMDYAAVHIAIKRFEQRSKKSRSLARLMGELRRVLSVG